MRRLLFLLAILPVFAGARAQAAPERQVEGEVISAAARWTSDGSRIITEAVVRTAEGDEVHLRQPGGTVDGIGMRVLHGPPLLHVGDRVSLMAQSARDLAGRASLVVQDVQRLAAAPTGRMDFARTQNSTGARLFWDSSCVFLTYDATGTPDLAGDLEFDIMDQVVARWQEDISSCSYLRFELEGREEREVGYDGVNVIKLRDDRWCRPATKDEPEECYSSGAAGLTTLYFIDDAKSPNNGKIFDADIELNGVHFSLSVGTDTEGTAPCAADLANTLTHELGHLMGLDHTCYAGAGARPVDHQGNPVPNCFPEELLSEGILEATMYTFQDCGETKKATPEPDDIAGVCAIYPIEDEAPACRRPGVASSGCCSVAGPGGTGEAGILALPLALVFAAAWLMARARTRARHGARSSGRG